MINKSDNELAQDKKLAAIKEELGDMAWRIDLHEDTSEEIQNIIDKHFPDKEGESNGSL